MRYLSLSAPKNRGRRGMILLIVMGMLALFAAVAVGFVFYADAEATAAQLDRQAITKEEPYIDSETLAGYFLSQFIYDTDNIYSAMRGWSLARSIYGYNPNLLNYTPYNAVGRSALSYPINFGGTAIDNATCVNYTLYDGVPNAADPYLGVLRNPEWYGKSNDGASFRYVGGANPPWTAYDTNSLFLAEVTADGSVLLPSFQRPWHKNVSSAGSAKYQGLRPDPNWHPGFNPGLTGFPFGLPDSDAGGDVRNLDHGPGALIGGVYYNNDSNWMDLGFPPMTAPNGRRFKPLFAPLVVDLSNRLHLWAHGNRIGGVASPLHVSNRGYGAPEVNLGLLPNLTAAELQALFNLKYGGMAGTAANLPTGSPITFKPAPVAPPWYSTIDADALDMTNALSSKQLFTGFATSSTAATPAGMNVTMSVAAMAATSPGGFPWAIQTGMTLGIDAGANAEQVSVISVNPGAGTFVANFAKGHAGGVPVTFNTLFPFPNYPSGWDNGAPIEITQRPLGFNLRNPIAPNIRPLALSNQEALLRFGGTSGPALTSELLRRMPNTFNNTPAGQRARNMVTLRNSYLDRVNASPVVSWNPTTPAANATKYRLGGGGYPVWTPGVPTPPPYGVPAALPANSEYTADWRSNLGNMLRVNLNRALTDYPAPAASGVITNMAVFVQAQKDRTDFALDIYNALIRVTGAQDPNTSAVGNVVVGSPEYRAARWLAQFAVNIVDYIDNDDHMTPFIWNAQAAAGSGGSIPSDIVFGTELPRLVLNEVYAQNDNDPNTTNTVAMTATTAKLNVWAELQNPFKATPAGSTYPNDGGNALLNNAGNYANYQVLVYPASRALSASMRDPANPTYNLGRPDPAGFPTFWTSNDWGTSATTRQVLPAGGKFGGVAGVNFLTSNIAGGGASEVGNTVTITTTAAHGFTTGQTVAITGVTDPGYNGSYPISSTPTATTFTYTNPVAGLAASGSGNARVGANDGLYVLGPAATFLPGRDPYLPTTYSSAAMSILRPATDAGQIPAVTLLLQRLAIPHLAPDGNPASATYNPYITVDYVETVPVNQSRQYNDMAALTPAAVGTFQSFGRNQPYAAKRSQFAGQAGAIAGTVPQTSFFQQNSNAMGAPFTWLTHLDRPPVNQLELLHVSGFKPHELTQQFKPTAQQHFGPWADPSSGLYRALEVLGTPNNMLGTTRGGRSQGNINLNTLTELEVFQALCDAQNATQPYVGFTQNDVQNILTRIIQSRTGNAGANYAPAGIPMPISEGAPFKGFAVGNLNETLFRVDAGGPIFYPPSLPVNAHRYAQTALLQKIFNNISTTSNVFAVHWTVGYFEVVDESVKPARLGAEIGRAENRHVRNRFFAIVDRSGLQLFNTTTTSAVAAGANQSVAVATFSGQLTSGLAWSVQPGMLLEVNDAGNPALNEVVAVKTVNAGASSFTADFAFAHAAGVAIVCRGNPGPRTNITPTPPFALPYNPRRDTGVVLHLSVIK